MIEKIKAFLESDQQEVSLDFRPINDYAEILSTLGFNTKYQNSLNLCNDNAEWDTNGWQVDFWWKIMKEDKNYTLSGSLFYGDFTLTKEEDGD